MRRFIQLFLACCFFLSAQRGWDQPSIQQAAADATAYVSHSPAKQPTRPVLSTQHKLKPWKQYFKRRPVGLNDGHEEGLAVYSFHTRLQFVYIHTRYFTQAPHILSVSLHLSDWRGPPVA